jgi:hypothetical protein
MPQLTQKRTTHNPEVAGSNLARPTIETAVEGRGPECPFRNLVSCVPDGDDEQVLTCRAEVFFRGHEGRGPRAALVENVG